MNKLFRLIFSIQLCMILSMNIYATPAPSPPAEPNPAPPALVRGPIPLADINEDFLRAVWGRDIAAAKDFLHSRRADIRATRHYSNYSATALHLAVMRGHYEMVEMLLQYGPDIHANLLDDGISIWATEVTPLGMALRNGHPALIGLLRGINASPGHDFSTLRIRTNFYTDPR